MTFRFAILGVCLVPIYAWGFAIVWNAWHSPVIPVWIKLVITCLVLPVIAMGLLILRNEWRYRSR
jgi:hypothetical protein